MLRRLISRYSLLFQLLVLQPFILMCLCSLVDIMVFRSLSEGYFESSPDLRLSMTAQALLENPLPTPVYIAHIDPAPGTIDQPYRVCISIRYFKKSALELWERTRILINGTRLARPDIGLDFSGEDFDTICTTVKLPPGLHLFELQIRDHPLGQYDIGEILSYQWAYEIKP